MSFFLCQSLSLGTNVFNDTYVIILPYICIYVIHLKHTKSNNIARTSWCISNPKKPDATNAVLCIKIIYSVMIYTVLNSTKHKYTLTDSYMVPYGQGEKKLNRTIMHYMVTMDHIATHITLTLFISSLLA